MIEQTELVINKWEYRRPAVPPEPDEQYFDFTYLDVMRKSAPTKKGIACRFTCRVSLKEQTILDYVAQDSYVIDLDDVIDKQELLSMIRNAYTKFAEKFDLRKLGTVLQQISLRPLDESEMDLDVLLPQLNL
jgi:hypothetical protein